MLSEILARATEVAKIDYKIPKNFSGVVELKDFVSVLKLSKALSQEGDFKLLVGVLPSTGAGLFFILFSQRYNLEITLNAKGRDADDTDELSSLVRGALQGAS